MNTKAFLWVSLVAIFVMQIILNRFAAAAKAPASTTLQGVDASALTQIGRVIPIININVALIALLIGSSTKGGSTKFALGLFLCLGTFVYNVVYSTKLFLGKNTDGSNKVQGLDTIVPGFMMISSGFMFFIAALLFVKMHKLPPTTSSTLQRGLAYYQALVKPTVPPVSAALPAPINALPVQTPLLS